MFRPLIVAFVLAGSATLSMASAQTPKAGCPEPGCAELVVGSSADRAFALELLVTMPADFDGSLGALGVYAHKSGSRCGSEPLLVSRIVPFGPQLGPGEQRLFSVLVPQEIAVQLAEPDTSYWMEVRSERLVEGLDHSDTAFTVERAELIASNQ